MSNRNGYEKKLRGALQRIEKTSERRVARRNARNALKRLLAEIWKEADKAYPPIRKDGTEVERVKKRGVWCPACDAPMKSFVALAKHAGINHKLLQNVHPACIRCWCGKTFRKYDTRIQNTSMLARHLAGVGRESLKAHYVIGALGRKE